MGFREHTVSGSKTPVVTAAGINAFWLGPSPTDPDAARKASSRWYAADDQLDDEIRRNFGAAMEQARTGTLSGWQETAEGSLALVILLDQFTRNAHRGTAAAFSGDAMARQVATGALDKGFDRALPIPGRLLLYHPFEHSENLEDQRRSVALFAGFAVISPSEWREYVDSFLRYARAHLEVIERFGRFPHRNAVLAREGTPAEDGWLSTHRGF